MTIDELHDDVQRAKADIRNILDALQTKVAPFNLDSINVGVVPVDIYANGQWEIRKQRIFRVEIRLEP